jgi:hypothetical protein
VGLPGRGNLPKEAEEASSTNDLYDSYKNEKKIASPAPVGVGRRSRGGARNDNVIFSLSHWWLRQSSFIGRVTISPMQKDSAPFVIASRASGEAISQYQTSKFHQPMA